MIAQKSIERFFLLVLFVISLGLNAQEHEDAHSEEATEEAFNPTELINHHVSDSHECHFQLFCGQRMVWLLLCLQNFTTTKQVRLS